jgi:mono/diheme cytochrome c family protein
MHTLQRHAAMILTRRSLVSFILLCLFSGLRLNAAPPPARTISFYKQILPLMHGRCQACHQPASAGGGLILTDFGTLMKGGEHGAVLSGGKPEASPIMEYLTGKRTLMPKGGPALPPAEIELFRRWIAEGASDDTPSMKDPIDSDHPPVYRQPPVITAMAYAPDGKTIAVSGYRETLLWASDGSMLQGRLVGQAEKILSLVYSPDGKLLVAAGGTPALFGEIQFWDPGTRTLISAPRNSYDTVFGASLSPDAKQVAFGCTDNTVRAISVPDGKQILRFDNHSDWPLSTTFATDGKHLLSAGRDQAIKLILLDGPTGSFIDDINTHTAIIRCLAREPKMDNVVSGGDDGIPRLYKVYRTEARTMNQEDHNLIRAFPRQSATITAVAFSPDGSLVAVGSEQGIVNLYRVADGRQVSSLVGHRGTICAIAFAPDGKEVATGGFDGEVRIYSPETGRKLHEFCPVPLQKRAVVKGERAAGEVTK